MFKIMPQEFILKVTPVDRIKCDSFNVNPTCHTHLSLDLATVGMVPFKSTLCVTYLLHEEIWVRACLKGDGPRTGNALDTTNSLLRTATDVLLLNMNFSYSLKATGSYFIP